MQQCHRWLGLWQIWSHGSQAALKVDLRRFIRNDVLPRGRDLSAGVVNCGFTLKPDAAGANRNRIRENYIAIYILRGSGQFVDWNGVAQRVRAGQILQLPAGRRHSVIHDADGKWAEAFLGINRLFHETLSRLGAIDASCPVLTPGLNVPLLLHFDYILRELKKNSAHARQAALVRAHELLVEMHRLGRPRTTDDRGAMIEAARHLLSGDLARQLDLPALARGFNLSYERFRKIFRERVGLAPHEYRIQRRIESARGLMADEGLSIKETAYALGYTDPLTFARQFKQITGIPPGEFRRRHGL